LLFWQRDDTVPPSIHEKQPVELRQLKSFLMVAEMENFHHAAEKLSVVPSALSRQIKDLEEELRIALFDRVRGRLRLSVAGSIYREHVQALLNGLDQAGQAARNGAGQQAATLTIAFFSIPVAQKQILDFVRGFREMYPKVTLTLVPMTATLILQALKNGTIDGAFLPNPPENAFEEIKLRSWELRLAVPASHPLATMQEVKLQDLRREPMIWPSRSVSPYFDDQLMKACAAKGLRPNIVHELPSTELRLSYVVAGLGVAFVISTRIADEGIKLIRLADLDLEVSMHFLWRKTHCSSMLQNFMAGFSRDSAF